MRRPIYCDICGGFIREQLSYSAHPGVCHRDLETECYVIIRQRRKLVLDILEELIKESNSEKAAELFTQLDLL